MKEAVEAYECTLSVRAKRDPKLIFSFARNKQCVKDQVRAVVKSGELVTDRESVAEVLNEQFKSVFVVKAQPQPGDLPSFEARRSDLFGVVDLLDCCSEYTVQETLMSLCSSKACGVDEVNPHVLKMCAKALARPLSLIFRKSLTEGKVPKIWKDANVTPIHKKGSRVVAANYRPVSLTSVICKVLERLIRGKLMEYLEEEKLISKEQHGFVKNRSCTTNL